MGGCLPAATLSELRQGLGGLRRLGHPKGHRPQAWGALDDMALVPGNRLAKEALAVGVATGLGVRLVEAPGDDGGWSEMLASCTPGIMGPYGDGEELEVARIRSLADDGPFETGRTRPYRVVDPCVSLAGLLGGGRPVWPGELTLAAHGVLHLRRAESWGDERHGAWCAEIVDVLRHGHVDVTRVDGTIRMPASTLVVASGRATNGDMTMGGLTPIVAGMDWRPDRTQTSEELTGMVARARGTDRKSVV